MSNSSDPFRQDVNMAAEDWERLGDYVIARRIALGMRDRRALAAATGVTASTLGAVENHLRWAPGSCRRVLAGGEPVSPASAAASQPKFDDPTLQHIAETPGLPPDVVRGMIALARNWREQEDERREQPRLTG